LGEPEDQAFQPKPPQIVGHLSGGVFLVGAIQQIDNDFPEVTIGIRRSNAETESAPVKAP
jgi:hypothetical protein